MNQELILDLFKNQQHFSKKLEKMFSAANVSCGDEIGLQVDLEEDKIKKAQFSGAACSITLASAEYLCRTIEGLRVSELDVEALRNGGLSLFGMTSTEKRTTCALLPYQALAELKQQISKI